MNAPATDCDSNACVRPRWQFDWTFLFALMTLVVLWAALLTITTTASKIILAIYAMTYLFGCWKTRRATLWILPAMYIPYVWLFADWSKWPISQYRWQWIEMLWHLPGLMVEAALHPLSEGWLQIVPSVATLAFFFTAVMLARPSLRLAIVTSIIVFALSLLNSSLCYRMFAA